MTGIVVAKPVNISFSADKLLGSGEKGNSKTTLIGNAIVTVDALTIRGERIDLYGKDYRFIKADGAIQGRDSEKDFSFSAQALRYDRKKEIAEFLGAAQVEDTKNDVKTAANRIKYNKKNETILLEMNVKLSNKNISCTSLFGLYHRNTSMLELTGNPAVKKDGDEFRAARISVNLDTEHIILDGNASGSVTETAQSDALPANTPENVSEKKRTAAGDSTESPAQTDFPADSGSKESSLPSDSPVVTRKNPPAASGSKGAVDE